jgi:hypothetical protein
MISWCGPFSVFLRFPLSFSELQSTSHKYGGTCDAVEICGWMDRTIVLPSGFKERILLLTGLLAVWRAWFNKVLVLSNEGYGSGLASLISTTPIPHFRTTLAPAEVSKSPTCTKAEAKWNGCSVASSISFGDLVCI